MSSCCEGYTCIHRAAFLAVAVGLTICLVACASPYWMVATVIMEQADTAPQAVTQNGVPMPEQPQKLDIHIGLWWYCLDLGTKGQECVYMYSPSDQHTDSMKRLGLPREDHSQAYITFIRTLAFLCVLITFVGLMMVLVSCSTCCSNGNTFVFGISFFVAGSCGFISVFLMSIQPDVLLNIPITDTKNDWAFLVFLTGNSIMFISSFVFFLRSSKRDSTVPYQMIFPVKNGHQVNQYELNGLVEASKALPNPATLTVNPKMNP